MYILESEVDNTYYIGHTKHIENRIREHNFGRTGYTKLKRPWRFFYSESFKTRSEAIKREKYLKSLKSRLLIEKLVHKGP